MPLPPSAVFRISVVLAASLAAPLAGSSAPDGWFVWPMLEPVDGSALDVSFLNPRPAGGLGRVAVEGGAFAGPDGGRLRFLGVNIAAEDAFPTADEAEKLARRLSKAGVNIARLHHLDNAWGVGSGGSIWPKEPGIHRELDAGQLDRLHRLIAILAKHGIYTNLNLKVSKTLVAADGFPRSVSELPDFQKRVDIFDRRMIELQKDYARRLLTTINPYTGRSPASDPAVAIVEINNENSILGYFTRDLGVGLERLPEPFKGSLRERWNRWLADRYRNTEELLAAWRENPAAPRELLGKEARWLAKIQAECDAVLSEGADGSSFRVEVTRTDGQDWHVQLSTHGLRLEENDVYTLSCELKASRPAAIGIGVSNDDEASPGAPWRSLGLLQTVSADTEWREVRLSFPAHSVAGAPGMLSFNVAAQTGLLEARKIRLSSGEAKGAQLENASLEAGSIPIPTEPSKRQWADWIAFLSDVEQGFAEEMRSYLREELKVEAPLICSQINFTGLPALNREKSMEFADTHTYWQHPDFPGKGWDPAVWTIKNTPMVSSFGARHFGELENLAYHRVADKPFSVSEYDHSAPSDYACEMYPELAIFACRQAWDAVYAFDLGSYGSRNPDGRISGFFDQINHPAKWSLAPFAACVFRRSLIPPAEALAEVRPGKPVWNEAMHFDMLWSKLPPGQSLDFLNLRLQISDRPGSGASAIVRSGKNGASPAKVVQAPQGQVLIACSPQAASATGFLGGASVDAEAFRVSCPRFGRDFATVAVLSLDGKPLSIAARLLVTLVARAENQEMTWNENRTSVGRGWGHGPTVVERVPARVDLAVDGPREVFALAPDGSRLRSVNAPYADGRLRLEVSPDDRTLHYEVARK